MRTGFVQRMLAVLTLSLFVGIAAIAPSTATAQDVSPTPAGWPEGPLGEQIQWLVDYINMPAADAAEVDLTTKFTPGVLADVSADELAAGVGLATSEVSLRGVVRSEGSFVGILQGVDSRNYIVRAGDKLADGTIQRITADTMVILQQINDPLSLEKQREVRKLLRQVEEAK